MVTYTEGRRIVAEAAEASVRAVPRARERVGLEAAFGRVLAEPLAADRDAPPFDRSTRDGFAVRSADVATVPATLKLVGEIAAGADFRGAVGAGECVQIMTGAAVPRDADAVVMIEHTQSSPGTITAQRSVAKGANVVPRGREAKAGAQVLAAGQRLGYAELSIAAQFGHAEFAVFARPRVAILSTGDELVPVAQAPGPFQIRNSNSFSLAAQVTLAGGLPVPLGTAADERGALLAKMEQGLAADALVLSGGVSMGKYDLVEEALRSLGAEFLFDSVSMRPGKPTAFGMCRGKPVLGLPGNPVSTMVTFELFGVPLLDVLSGAPVRSLPLASARTKLPIREKASLAHFLPARLSRDGGETYAEQLSWQGSGDAAALAQADSFLVVTERQLEFAAGEWVDVLLRRDRM